MAFTTLAGPLQPQWVPKIGVSFKRHLNGNLLPVQTIVNLLQGVGAKIARFDLMWADCETSPGVYNFSAYTPLVNALKAAGITPLIILARGNPIYTGAWHIPPTTDAHRAAFANFAVAALNACGVASAYEVMNEPDNAQMWGATPSAEHYGKLLAAVSVAMKAANANASVHGGGLSVVGNTAQFFADYLTYIPDKTKVTTFCYHPYTGGDAYLSNPAMRPERVRDRMVGIRPAGTNYPISNSEQGFYLTECNGSTVAEKEARQGAFATRFVLSSMILQNFAIWYNLINDGTDMTDREQGLGLYRNDLTIKPAGVQFKAVMNLLNGVSTVLIERDGDYYRSTFTYSNGSIVVVPWTAGAAGTHTVQLAETTGPMVVRTL